MFGYYIIFTLTLVGLRYFYCNKPDITEYPYLIV